MKKNSNKNNMVICAGGVVINPKYGIVVVNQNNDSWSLPKGHVENHESILEAAKREIYEETGLKKLIYIKSLGAYERYRIGLDGKDDLSELKLIHLFLFLTNEKHLSPQDKHNPEACWASINRVRKLLTHRSDKKYFMQSTHFFKEHLS